MSKISSLGDIVTFVGGGTPDRKKEEYWGGEIPWATVKDFNSGNLLKKPQESITQIGLKSSAANLIKAGTLIIPTRMALGKAAIASVDMAINQDLKAVIPNTNIDTRYLLWYFIANSRKIDEMGKGATVKGVTLDQLRQLKINIPALEEQRRIAAILDKAEALRAKRREAIARLDRLLQSVFLEMFGDPVRNEKNWQRVALGDLLTSIDSGKSPVCLDRKAQENEWGVLKLGAVTKCRYIASENKALPENETPDSRHEVKEGDLLFSRKNTRELVAACAIVRETPAKLLLPDLIFRLVIKKNNRISPIYLHSLLIYPTKRKEVQSLAGGAAGSMPNISKAKLSDLLVELPNIELQKKYETIANSIEELRKKNLDSLLEIEVLIQSIQSKFFNI